MLYRKIIIVIFCCYSTLALGVEQLGYRIVDKKAQDRSLWTQGLEFNNGQLYISAGLYGQSQLLRYNFDSGETDVSRRLHPRLFAEGLTVFGDKVFQLTWKEKMMLVFNKDDLEALEWFPIIGQGWGLTNNGEDLIYSDGSDSLHFLSPDTRKIHRSVKVTENGKPLNKLNELEWIDGLIWANVWQTDRIVIIDPDSGVVTASIDLTGLLPASERKSDTGVLNGIAINPHNGGIWVTGKRWPWMYRIEPIAPEKTQTPANSR